MKIDVIAVGQLKKGPLYDLVQRYHGMISWDVTLHELKNSTQIKPLLNPRAVIFALDERGVSTSSMAFAKDLQERRDQGVQHFQFIIGEADGLTDEIRKSAHKLISFGKQTWPHMLARVMLMEQIYRAQQILKGHPYHRE